MVKVSIIIPNYNGERFIEGLFKSLSLQDFLDFEVIFVDNNSSDDSLQILNKTIRQINFPVKVLINNENEGYCKANNFGVSIAEGNYIVFLNNDTYVSRTWLEKLVEVLEMNPRVGACGSKIISADTGYIQSTGLLLDKYGWVGFSADDSIELSCLIDKFFYASFVAVIIRREILSKCGGFDGTLFLTGDYDLGWMIRLYGYSHAVALNSLCYHYGSYTVRMFQDISKFYLQYKEKIYILLKNFSYDRLIRRFPISAALMIMSSIYKSLKLRKPYVLAILRAFLWNLRNWRIIWIARIKVQSQRVVNDDKIDAYMYPSSFMLKTGKQISLRKNMSRARAL